MDYLRKNAERSQPPFGHSLSERSAAACAGQQRVIDENRERAQICSLAPLLLRPRPFDDELWTGYLLRLASANELSSIASLARYLRVTSRELTYGEIAHDSAIPGIKLGSARKSKVNLRATRTRLCPICIRSVGYEKASWSRPFSLHCPEHHCSLVDYCDYCGAGVSTQRKSLGRCKCGRVYSEIKACPTPSYIQYAYAMFFEASARDSVQKTLHEDDERVAARALEAIATFNNSYKARIPERVVITSDINVQLKNMFSQPSRLPTTFCRWYVSDGVSVEPFIHRYKLTHFTSVQKRLQAMKSFRRASWSQKLTDKQLQEEIAGRI